MAGAVCTAQRWDVPLGTGSTLEVSGAAVLCGEGRKEVTVAAGVTCETGQRGVHACGPWVRSVWKGRGA